jgi:uncharacterized membrane protein
VTPEEQERFAALERRVEELERRVLHERRDIAAEPHRPPVVPAPVLPRPTPEPPRGAVRPRELTFGLNWISRIAVVTVVLALAFFFDYAFENRWITESGRVLLGLGCGIAAFAAGEYFFRRGQRAYGQALAAAGAAFFYLSLWAAFGLYHLLPQVAAFALMILTTAAAGYLAFRYDSPSVALLGLAGGFATPLLLHGGDQPWFVLSYALVLSAGAVQTTRLRRWRWPEALAVVGTAALYLSQVPAHPFYAIFVVASYALFAASEGVGVFIAAQILAAVALATIWTPGETGIAGVCLLSAAGLAIAGRRGRAPAAAGAFLGFWLAYGLWRLAAGYTPLLVLTAGYAIFLAWPLWRALGRGASLRFLELALLAVNAGLYFSAAYGLLRSEYASYVGLFAVGLAIAQAIAARLLWRADARGAVLSAGAAWAILILAAPIQFAGYRVTVIWAAEAAAMVWIGTRLAQRRAVLAALAVFGLVVLRLVFSDARMYASPGGYDLILNARFLAFAVAAAAFWAAAWWLSEGRLAMAVYTAGHAVMLAGLSLEAAGWAARTAAPENFVSVVSTSISVIAAAYAVLLVGLGAAWRHAGSRLMGMGLIGIVVLKLYLYDVWLLGAFYRMAAFAILGVMLLVMSYLYSRRAGQGPAPREP